MAWPGELAGSTLALHHWLAPCLLPGVCLVGGTEVSTWSLPLTGIAILGDTEMPQLPGKAHAWGRMSQGLMAEPPTASRDCQGRAREA